MKTKEEILKIFEKVSNEMNNPKVINTNIIFLTNGLTKKDYEAYYGKQPNIEFIKPQKLTIKRRKK